MESHELQLDSYIDFATYLPITRRHPVTLILSRLLIPGILILCVLHTFSTTSKNSYRRWGFSTTKSFPNTNVTLVGYLRVWTQGSDFSGFIPWLCCVWEGGEKGALIGLNPDGLPLLYTMIVEVVSALLLITLKLNQLICVKHVAQRLADGSLIQR